MLLSRGWYSCRPRDLVAVDENLWPQSNSIAVSHRLSVKFSHAICTIVARPLAGRLDSGGSPMLPSLLLTAAIHAPCALRSEGLEPQYNWARSTSCRGQVRCQRHGVDHGTGLGEAQSPAAILRLGEWQAGDEAAGSGAERFQSHPQGNRRFRLSSRPLTEQSSRATKLPDESRMGATLLVTA